MSGDEKFITPHKDLEKALATQNIRIERILEVLKLAYTWGYDFPDGVEETIIQTLEENGVEL